ncbi:class I SAM-dependent methyltransferase [Ketobacter sp. MCCC 1A13808]|uniref:class I SAM-dependent methyltransferase n=1 Tax=Ketobacter sp. MCCC 1A13808 TaxID=2602738 RepID=UPI0012EBA8D7|nr:class I SAM-dependent methyltransferase [Ketobacter sp. MCCC 1A13808]MVF13600.1 class I SAM-dependent methyltransferase [Ketobacter sp. MCCC 1A13808]
MLSKLQWQVQDTIQSAQLSSMSCNILSILGESAQEFNIIDLCCGSANVLEYKLRLSHINSYTGIDIDSNALQIARRRYPDYRFIHEDIFTIPLDNFIDSSAIVTCFSNTLLGLGQDRIKTWLRRLSDMNPQALLFAFTPEEKLDHIFRYAKWIAIENQDIPDLKVRVVYDKHSSTIDQFVLMNSRLGTFVNQHTIPIISITNLKYFLRECGWDLVNWYDSCSLNAQSIDISYCESLIYAKPIS